MDNNTLYKFIEDKTGCKVETKTSDDLIIYAVLGGHGGEPLRRYRLSDKEIARVNNITIEQAQQL